MFKEILLFKKVHEELASEIASGVKEGLIIKDGLLIVIFGIAGTGKSEIAWWLSRKLYCKNFSSHIISLDRFYKIPIEQREEWRKQTNIIGPEELDWVKINKEIEDFKRRDSTDFLIIEGLYAGYIEGANQRIYLKGTLESTFDFRKIRGKENPESEWRQKVLLKEKEAVEKSVKENDEIYIVS